MHRAVLRGAAELAPGTKHFEWEVISPGRFDFLAGQFISLRVKRNGEQYTRPYSIASAPRREPLFDLCLNRVPCGFVSNYLCDLAVGAEIEFSGPHGNFAVRQPIDRDLVFIATGTGIAPIRGMLADLLARKLANDRQIWLLFGVRYPETILYRKEFESWAAAHPNFHFTPTLSRAPAAWQGHTGHVQEQLRHLFAGRTDFAAYICGLRAMVEKVRGILKREFGLDRKQIHAERYD